MMNIKLNTRLFVLLFVLIISADCIAQNRNVRNSQNKKQSQVQQKQKQQQQQKANKNKDNDPLSIQLKAPTKIEVSEVFESMSKGKKPGLKVNVPYGDAATIMKNWKKYMKSFGGKQRTSSGELFSDNAIIADLSENTVDVYTKVEPFAGGVLMKVFFDLGGAYVSERVDKGKFNVAANILRDFATNEAARSLQAKLGQEEEALMKLASDRAIMNDIEQQLMQEIVEYEAALVQRKSELERLQKEQKRKNEATKKQIGVIEQLKHNLKAIFQK